MQQKVNRKRIIYVKAEALSYKTNNKNQKLKYFFINFL
jgi:hypothetical protein